jgi:copper oxidase (laccase) domain-containing protein
MNEFITYGPRRIAVVLSGRPQNWYGLYSGNRSVLANLGGFVDTYIPRTEVIVPNVTSSNGVVLDSEFFHNRDIGDTTLRYGKPADGVVVKRGEAVVFATGDCPVVLMYSTSVNFCVAAHAGRKSLVGDIDDPKDAEHTVIANMLRHFMNVSTVRVVVLLGISGQYFIHDPKNAVFGKQNKRLIKFISTKYGEGCFVDKKKGALSLHQLILVQCVSSGVNPSNIEFDKRDTYTDTLPDGSFRWWSHRRGDIAGRNLVLVENPS